MAIQPQHEVSANPWARIGASRVRATLDFDIAWTIVSPRRYDQKEIIPGWRMSEPILRFPAKCPRCTTENLNHMYVADVADALVIGEPIKLYAPCCQFFWNASAIEREQIREYIAASWLPSDPPKRSARRR